ncbi:MAG: isopenicillin N synthase family dioxygenase [Alphaproteobacteria bacterium]
MPILDLADYRNGVSDARAQAAADLRHIQETLGFYYVTSHGVPADLLRRAFDLLAIFYAQPMEEKLKLRVDRHQIGYIPPKASVMKTDLAHVNRKPDLNEGFSMMRERTPDDPKVVAGVRFSGLNKWPSVPGFRETFLAYHREMEALGRRLLPLYALALGQPDTWFDRHFTDAHFYNRTSHYPPTVDAEEEQYSIGAHSDHNFMALLPMAEEPGLEYATPSGRWTPAPVVEGAIIVNTGEFLNRWTNGRFRAIPHRVVVPARDRYALTFHYSPNDETVCEPLDTCVGPDNPPRYRPKTFLQHLTDYIDASYAPQAAE